VVEDIVPCWIRRVPGVRRLWFSFRTLPIRNWILQQIVKLSVAKVVPAEVLFFVDSDVFFCAPFNPQAWTRDGRPPCSSRPVSGVSSPTIIIGTRSPLGYWACSLKPLTTPTSSET
jgi:hypothetical protein